MAQLIAFLQSGQLSQQQVKTLIQGFRADGQNSKIYADITGDGAITTNDLITFLSFYGLPASDPSVDSIEPSSGYNQSEFNTSPPFFPNE
jgi:Ca2+-binding EF-hand superfamily protein